MGVVLVKACRSLALLMTGGLMVSLCVTGRLWQYLNPDFEPLVAIAGGALLVMGCLTPFAPLGPRAWRELIPAAVFACFLLLAGWSLARPLVSAEPQRPSFGDDPFYPEPKPRGEPRIQWRGSEYVRLNTSELLTVADKGTAPERVAVWGMVLKAPDETGAERTILARAQIVCCLADALGVGVELEGGGVEDLRPGEWVRVLGRTTPGPARLSTGSVPWPGVVIVVLDENLVLRAEDIRAMDTPEMPYIFDVYDQEPFAD